MKLTRKAIAEGLESVPIDAVILGAANSKEKRLTAKQREFARQIALGESKASAYRKSRETKAKPETASRRGQEIAKDGAVAAQIEAFKLAIEAERSRTPAHLRALVVQKLTEKALDPDVPPAQQIKALELLGKITEVALFTERREVVQVKDSGEIRERLMQSIRAAIQSSAQDVEIVEADSLLAEISGSHIVSDNVTDGAGASTVGAAGGDSHFSSDNVTIDRGEADSAGADDTRAGDVGAGMDAGAGATPPGATPLSGVDTHTPVLHSIPHTQSSENGLTNSVDSNVTLAGDNVTCTDNNISR